MDQILKPVRVTKPWKKIMYIKSKIGRFLETFASQSATMKSGHKGANNLIPILAEYELTSALASTETLTLTLPTGLSPDYVPIAFAIWSNAAPQLPVFQPHTANALLMTNHNRTTGVTVFTAGTAGVADNSVISVFYVPATLGS